MGRKRWTPEHDAQLAAMRAEGHTFDAIALAVGHGAASCHTRATVLGIYKRKALHRETYASPMSEEKMKAKKRIPCMNDSCKKPFISAGAHNRLCPNCRHQSLTAFDTPAQVLR
ncbi:MAG TPA: hypothetical protein VJ396_07020 [Acidiferrobacterales bacterium]|nr:hypothetical protein [Acidiferrobacterales bacterium]